MVKTIVKTIGFHHLIFLNKETNVEAEGFEPSSCITLLTSSTCLGLSFLTYQKYLSFITTLNDIDSSSTWLLYHTKSVPDSLTSHTLISES